MNKKIVQVVTSIPGTQLQPDNVSFKQPDGTWDGVETPFSTNKRLEFNFTGTVVHVTFDSSGTIHITPPQADTNPQPNLTRNTDGSWPAHYIYKQ